MEDGLTKTTPWKCWISLFIKNSDMTGATSRFKGE